PPTVGGLVGVEHRTFGPADGDDRAANAAPGLNWPGVTGRPPRPWLWLAQVVRPVARLARVRPEPPQRGATIDGVGAAVWQRAGLRDQPPAHGRTSVLARSRRSIRTGRPAAVP